MARVVASPSSRPDHPAVADVGQRPVNVGWALLHEGGDALAEVVGAQQRQQLQEHVVHVLLERLGLGRAHHPLDRPHRERGVGGDLAGELARVLPVSSSSATTWFTSPSSSASGAVSVRPVKAISAAFA